MIPFDVEPSLYIPSILAAVGFIICFIGYVGNIPGGRTNFDIFFGIIFLVISIGTFMIFPFSASMYTDTITICAHTEGNYMKVIDTNENLYYVSDAITQMKVKDNITVKVKIEDKIGTKFIYYIDAPITCGNSSCGVSQT